MDEKRKNRRSDLNNKLRLEIIGAENGRKFPAFDVDIIDVSSNGIGFHTDEQLMIGEMFNGELELWTKQKLNVVIKVVRSSVEEEGYNYGCIFIGLQNADSMHIKIYQMLDEV